MLEVKGSSKVVKTATATESVPLFTAPVLPFDTLSAVQSLMVSYHDGENDVQTQLTVAGVRKHNSTFVEFVTTVEGETVRIRNGESELVKEDVKFPLCSANATCASFDAAGIDVDEMTRLAADELRAAGFNEQAESHRLRELYGCEEENHRHLDENTKRELSTACYCTKWSWKLGHWRTQHFATCSEKQMSEEDACCGDGHGGYDVASGQCTNYPLRPTSSPCREAWGGRNAGGDPSYSPYCTEGATAKGPSGITCQNCTDTQNGAAGFYSDTKVRHYTYLHKSTDRRHMVLILHQFMGNGYSMYQGIRPFVEQPQFINFVFLYPTSPDNGNVCMLIGSICFEDNGGWYGKTWNELGFDGDDWPGNSPYKRGDYGYVDPSNGGGGMALNGLKNLIADVGADAVYAFDFNHASCPTRVLSIGWSDGGRASIMMNLFNREFPVDMAVAMAGHPMDGWETHWTASSGSGGAGAPQRLQTHDSNLQYLMWMGQDPDAPGSPAGSYNGPGASTTGPEGTNGIRIYAFWTSNDNYFKNGNAVQAMPNIAGQVLACTGDSSAGTGPFYDNSLTGTSGAGGPGGGCVKELDNADPTHSNDAGTCVDDDTYEQSCGSGTNDWSGAGCGGEDWQLVSGSWECSSHFYPPWGFHKGCVAAGNCPGSTGSSKTVPCTDHTTGAVTTCGFQKNDWWANCDPTDPASCNTRIVLEIHNSMSAGSTGPNTGSTGGTCYPNDLAGVPATPGSWETGYRSTTIHRCDTNPTACDQDCRRDPTDGDFPCKTEWEYDSDPDADCEGFFGTTGNYQAHYNFLTDDAMNEFRVEEAIYNFVRDAHVCDITMSSAYPSSYVWTTKFFDDFKHTLLVTTGSKEDDPPPEEKGEKGKDKRRKLLSTAELTGNKGENERKLRMSNFETDAQRAYYEWNQGAKDTKHHDKKLFDRYIPSKLSITPITDTPIQKPSTIANRNGRTFRYPSDFYPTKTKNIKGQTVTVFEQKGQPNVDERFKPKCDPRHLSLQDKWCTEHAHDVRVVSKEMNEKTVMHVNKTAGDNPDKKHRSQWRKSTAQANFDADKKLRGGYAGYVLDRWVN
jgi:hypothetical protein